MRRSVRRRLSHWLPWFVMTVVVVGTYVECARVIYTRSADRFTGSQGRELADQIKALEQKIHSLEKRNGSENFQLR